MACLCWAYTHIERQPAFSTWLDQLARQEAGCWLPSCSAKPCTRSEAGFSTTSTRVWQTGSADKSAGLPVVALVSVALTVPDCWLHPVLRFRRSLDEPHEKPRCNSCYTNSVAKKETVGGALWLSLYRAGVYDVQAAAIGASPSGKEMSPELATRRWLQGMSRHLKETFPERLRGARERLGITQQRLSEIAGLSETGLAMIERGERVPNLDTAARICWALDFASGVTLAHLQ